MTAVDEFRAAARQWLASDAGQGPADWGAILPPRLDAEGRAWQRRLFDAGFAGIDWPSEYGGRGLTPDHASAWMEEAAAAGIPAVLNMVGLVLAARALLAYGTDEQKAEHLPPTVRGERVWCQLFSEPGSGSDLASPSTIDAVVRAPGARLGGGTSEIQRTIIGELVLGLPKEPKASS